MDVKNWQNPYLIVRADGIEVVGVSKGKGSPTIDAALAVLEGLPESAWPYGRVGHSRRGDHYHPGGYSVAMLLPTPLSAKPKKDIRQVVDELKSFREGRTLPPGVTPSEI